MQLATQTKALIDRAIERDAGASYRGHLRESMNALTDAFNSVEDLLPRSHLGASLIGGACPRAMWYGFRWCFVKQHEARIQLLFNRGHLEEGRFIAQFQAAGFRTLTVSDEGKQFKFDGYKGYYGGSLDAFVFGIPEFPFEWVLGEFKTSGDAGFKKLRKSGVASAKPEHYAQVQQYLGAFGLNVALYGCVNKNDDDRHFELVTFDSVNHAHHAAKAKYIVDATEPPARISASPSSHDCRFCDAKEVCFRGCEPLPTCRTCSHVAMPGDGRWYCTLHGLELTKHQQFAGCQSRRPLDGL